ncbi:FAD-dependent oxidoreductase [Compostimonas suwonensis]|uniref:Glycine/D-amino acid oxidase-like deaminating enzyme n=1 Tax=Compostimonas suwonensis TaxID=1048394 RepID=A0A2M9C4W9_9MICO|nr:FAD-dependent oxidoreductase [Compostimonas suwonensis]PJJ65573.1 glycine/D-amino acid oxidase-like deaminating enzyme [Compostimonas suwonensis]
MQSIWLRHERPTRATPFAEGQSYDDVVVGAGITGLSTALMLAERGRKVAVLEARAVAAATTGNSTGKLSLLQGTRLSTIARDHPRGLVSAYVDANRDGLEWLTAFCELDSVPIQFRDAVTYAETAEGVSAVDAEFEAAFQAGLPVTRQDDAGLPFPTRAAVRLAGQAQIDPAEVADALAARFVAEGGVLHEGVRVTGVHAGHGGSATSAGSACVVRTSEGELHAGDVVLATGTPILDRGLYFAKLTAHRSYALAYPVESRLFDDMGLSTDAMTVSLRQLEAEGEEFVLVGGNGHEVGRSQPTSERIAELDSWARSHLAVGAPAFVWSAQDYESANLVPFAGKLPRGRGHVYLATGFAKWGLTNGVAAALRISAEILGDPPRAWVRTIGTRLTLPSDLGRGIGANAAVGMWAARGWWRAITAGGSPERPPEGEARVVTHAGRPTAVSTIGGRSCAVDAVCPHLGGIVAWNDAESSWDCPLHGSRFAADGELLEGPATRGLTRLR